MLEEIIIIIFWDENASVGRITNISMGSCPKPHLGTSAAAIAKM
jgi:hypothetical protein